MWPKSNHPPISNDFKRIPARAFLGVKIFKFLKILICHIFGSIICPTNIFETLIICLFFFKSTAGIVPLIHWSTKSSLSKRKILTCEPQVVISINNIFNRLRKWRRSEMFNSSYIFVCVCQRFPRHLWTGFDSYSVIFED